MVHEHGEELGVHHLLVKVTVHGKNLVLQIQRLIEDGYVAQKNVQIGSEIGEELCDKAAEVELCLSKEGGKREVCVQTLKPFKSTFTEGVEWYKRR